MHASEFLGRLLESLFRTHPLHGMLVHFPIGLSGVGLLFVVLALAQRSEVLERAAWYCIALTAFTTVLAGFSGYRDVIVRFDGEAPLIGIKGYLAVTLFLLTTALAVTRSRRSEVLWNPSTMVLYVTGYAGSFALCLTLAFLGGVILYGF
jgi:uncharacterized membrane protein